MSVPVAPSAIQPAAAPEGRVNRAYFVRAYGRMFAWELAALRLFLPMLASVLVLQGAGFILGIGLFFHHMPTAVALYMTTGVPVINLLTLGLIFEPQLVADERAQGTYEFQQALPAPRSMSFLAWYTVTLIPTLPAVVFALFVGVAHYHLHLDVSPSIVLALLLTSLTGTLMGYAIAHGVAAPMTVRILSTSIIFVIFGFSPILFPPSRLPEWLVEINRWLPFESMATIVRAGLVSGLVTGVRRAYAVVGAWAVVSALVSARAVGHRK